MNCDYSCDYSPSYKGIFWGKTSFLSYRDYGPCLITDSGSVHYSTKPGISSRRVGPSVIFPNGAISYRVNDKLHRTNGPAVIGVEDKRWYWVNGKNLNHLDFFIQYGNI